MNPVSRSSASAKLLLVLSLGCQGASDTVNGADTTTGCPAPSFEGRQDLVETGSMEESPDRCWWLSSGGRLSIEQGVARTLQGTLPDGSKWREDYAKSNPVDTDEGERPQNIFRLVTRNQWLDYRQEVRFRITHVNLSNSPERGEWSGVFLFQRYLDADNLYYAGLRMDGTAVIKKKLDGKYVTLAQRSLYGLPESYDRQTNTSLLPTGQWITLASVIRNGADGAVHIRLLTRDRQARDGWRTAAEALDSGQDGAPIRTPGHGGLRADFMDIEFQDYAVTRE